MDSMTMTAGGMIGRFTPSPRAAAVVRVGMDLDGVNYVFERSYFDTLVALDVIRDATDYWTCQEESGPPIVRFKEAGSWTFYEAYGHNAEEFVAFCHKGADLGIIFGRQPIQRAAQDAWRTIKESGHEIHVKTNRSFGSHPAVSHANTRNWLHDNGLEYDSLTFCANKLDGPSVDMMLEDNVDNYDALDAAGVQVWLIDRPWNHDPDDGGVERRRVYTHAEFVTRVQAYARRVARSAATPEGPPSWLENVLAKQLPDHPA